MKPEGSSRFTGHFENTTALNFPIKRRRIEGFDVNLIEIPFRDKTVF
jgi:hypothetical protein